MEHELDYVLIVRNFNFPFYPNPEEVEDVRHVSRQELTKMLRDESIKFSPWFHLMYTSKQLEKWWTKLDANEAINYDETIRRLN
jgi:isopentenyldiphosphate isomerase